MYFVFCRLYPSSSAVFRILPIISLLLINAPGAGLPIRMIEEVSWEPKRRRAWASHYLIPRLWHLRINNNIWNSNSFYFVKILTCSMWCRLAWTYRSRTLQSYPWYITHVNLKRCPYMTNENTCAIVFAVCRGDHWWNNKYTSQNSGSTGSTCFLASRIRIH